MKTLFSLECGVALKKSAYYALFRVYPESSWGKRILGPGRLSFDFGRISFAFERYTR